MSVWRTVKSSACFFERSEQAIEESDRKHGPAAKETASNILKDRLDVEECVNVTYLRTRNSIPLQSPNPLASYVCRIPHNLAIDHYHANHAGKRGGLYHLVLDEIAECIPSRVNLETEREAKELGAAINRFLQSLGKDDRWAVETIQ